MSAVLGVGAGEGADDAAEVSFDRDDIDEAEEDVHSENLHLSLGLDFLSEVASYNKQEDNIEASSDDPDPVETPVGGAGPLEMEKYVGEAAGENDKA